MMKIRYAGSVILSILLLSGCATEKESPSTDVETPAVNDSETAEEKPVTENPDQPEKGVELAKQTVECLENNSLPIPIQHGLVRLDASGENHHAIWAKDAILYELSEVRSAEDLLKILATFE